MSGKLKEVRDRMKSVRSTQQITNAMKMVSAAKLRRGQEAIIQARPFAQKVNSILLHILSDLDKSVYSPFSQAREVKKALVIVVTSNRGLCGAFNSNVIKIAVKRIEEQYQDVRAQGGLSILCIGKRGHDYFRKRYTDCTIVDDFVELFTDLTFENSAVAANKVVQEFAATEYDKIDIAYSRFKNPATQFPEIEDFLPVPLDRGKSRRRANYIFEPSQESLLSRVVPASLRIKFFRCMLDTHASEHGARMTAMDKATENAEELLKDLRINYNKARQETITKELSEIVGGAAALEG